MERKRISAFCSHTLTLGKKFHSELASSINQSGCSLPPTTPQAGFSLEVHGYLRGAMKVSCNYSFIGILIV